MELTMKDLEQCFEDAEIRDASFIGIKIFTRGSSGAEIIINPKENFKAKLKYYKDSYTENLTLKKFDGIQIIDFSAGDSFDDIECALEDN